MSAPRLITEEEFRSTPRDQLRDFMVKNFSTRPGEMGYMVYEWQVGKKLFTGTVQLTAKELIRSKQETQLFGIILAKLEAYYDGQNT